MYPIPTPIIRDNLFQYLSAHDICPLSSICSQIITYHQVVNTSLDSYLSRVSMMSPGCKPVNTSVAHYLCKCDATVMGI